MKKISIVVPCYNEEETIPIFYEEVNKVAEKLKDKATIEFVFVNDGSKDKTLITLRELAKKDKRVRYISFSRNFGKEAGMLAGLEYTTGDYVTTMDSRYHKMEFWKIIFLCFRRNSCIFHNTISFRCFGWIYLLFNSLYSNNSYSCKNHSMG